MGLHRLIFFVERCIQMMIDDYSLDETGSCMVGWACCSLIKLMVNGYWLLVIFAIRGFYRGKDDQKKFDGFHQTIRHDHDDGNKRQS